MEIASVQDLMEYTGKRVDNPEESLQIFIDTAYSILCNYLGYDLEMNFITEYVQGYGDNKLQLKHRPIHIVYDVIDFETQEILYESEYSPIPDYVITNDFVEFRNIIFPKKKLVVSYLYGYGSLNFSANESIGGNASTVDWINSSIGMGADLTNLIYEEISGGRANSFPLVEEYVPSIFKLTLLRLAALLLSEADNNIGITSKSFADSGTRTFVNYTSFDKYLQVLSKYKRITI
jgi:hypothetical protein